jgi:hypothetical protein
MFLLKDLFSIKFFDVTQNKNWKRFCVTKILIFVKKYLCQENKLKVLDQL